MIKLFSLVLGNPPSALATTLRQLSCSPFLSLSREHVERGHINREREVC